MAPGRTGPIAAAGGQGPSLYASSHVWAPVHELLCVRRVGNPLEARAVDVHYEQGTQLWDSRHGPSTPVTAAARLRQGTCGPWTPYGQPRAQLQVARR